MLPSFSRNIPELLKRSSGTDASATAMITKSDSNISDWFDEIMEMVFLKVAERCPSLLLDELGYMFSAGILSFDSERVKRNKIFSAVARHKKRGSWKNDIKEIVDVIAGGDSELVKDYFLAQWILWGFETLDIEDFSSVLSGGNADGSRSYYDPIRGYATFVSDWGNTKLCSSFNGIDGAVTYTDPIQGAAIFGGSAQLDTAQFKFGTSSLYLPYATSYISYPDSDDYAFGTGDFTIDFWIRLSTINTMQFIAFMATGATNHWNLYINAVNTLKFEAVKDGTTIFDYSYNWTTIATDTWYHIALTRNGTTGNIYINGVAQIITRTTDFGTKEMPNVAARLFIGNSFCSLVGGRIDEFRITKGVALWVSDFIVPTHEGANTCELDTSQKKFGTASLYCPGDYRYITYPDSNNFNFGADDFTIDFWVKLYKKDTNQYFMYKSVGAGGIQLYLYITSSNRLYFYSYSTPPATYYADIMMTSAWSFNLDQWYHIAFVRNGITGDFYIDGIKQTCTKATDFGTTTLPDIAAAIRIGYDVYGHIDEFRITKGVARWTSNFTPETEALEYINYWTPYWLQYTKIKSDFEGADGAVAYTDPIKGAWTFASAWGTTVLCSSFDGADGGTSYTDPIQGAGTFVGTAQLDTAQKKFGTASLLLDGNSDYLTYPDSDDYVFGTGDFTIDLWVRFASIQDTGLVGQYVDASNFWDLYATQADNRLYFRYYIGGSNFAYFWCTWTPVIDTWYHIAVVRTGANLYMFINGIPQTVIVVTPITAGTSFPNLASTLRIGFCQTSAYYHNGWIDEVRVLKGYAFWDNRTFIPPTRAYTMSPVLSTLDYQEGTSSLYLYTLTNYLYYATSVDFAFGSGDFTIEFCVKNYQFKDGYYLYKVQDATNRWHIRLGTNGTVAFYHIQGGVVIADIKTTVSMTLDKWHHVAFVRQGEHGYFYIDGVKQTCTVTVDFGFSELLPNSATLNLGGSAAVKPLCSIDGFNLLKGIAKYTENFMPQENIKLLSSFDTEDEEGAFLLTDGTESEIEGIIWIDVDNVSLTTTQIQQLVDSLQDNVPAYMRVILGYVDAVTGLWVTYTIMG